MTKSVRNVVLVAGAAALLLTLYSGLRRRLPRSDQATSSAPSLAPEFSLTAIDGQKLDLADYHGKVVLLNFWATWCTPCRAEIPHFVQLQTMYGAAGLQIIGISMDDEPAPVRQFYRDFHINYPVALGGAKLGELYGGIFGLPISFVIGRDGKILTKHIGAVSISSVETEIAGALPSRTGPTH